MELLTILLWFFMLKMKYWKNGKWKQKYNYGFYYSVINKPNENRKQNIIIFSHFLIFKKNIIVNFFKILWENNNISMEHSKFWNLWIFLLYIFENCFLFFNLKM